MTLQSNGHLESQGIHLTRRRVLQTLFSSAAMGTIAPGSIWAQDEIQSLYVDDDIDRAVKKGIKYLVAVAKQNGAIVDRGHDVAMTALAIMAMASIGIEPGVADAESLAMSSAIDFVLTARHQDASGYYGNADGSRMYGHGIITLMLTEMLGMGSSPAQNKRIHDSLEKAIKLILKAQAVRKSKMLAGGWRYTPSATDSDLSVSVWQLMAMRSAKNDGLEVPSVAIEKAIDYLKYSYTSPRSSNNESSIGGFSYTPGHHHPSFTMTSAGLLAMQVCGQYDSPTVKGALNGYCRIRPKPKSDSFTTVFTTTLKACTKRAASTLN